MSSARYILCGIALMPIGPAAIAGGELDAWAAAKAAGTCGAWQTFIDVYPASKLAGMARTRLDACAAADQPQPLPAQPTPATAPAGTARPILPTGPAGPVSEPHAGLASEPASASPFIQPPRAPIQGTPAADTYIVLPTGDGFVAVRRGPSTGSAEVTRLYAEQRVACSAIVPGQRLSAGDRWVHCPLAGGYIYATLLAPKLTGVELHRFVARATSDGFVAVRSAATTSLGYRVAKLTPGQTVHCDRLVRGEELTEGPYWLHCREVGGYVHAPLLIPD